MALIYTGDFLMADGGLAFSTDCCCKSLNCYCYVHSLAYGSSILERRVLCFREPEWDDAAQKWVFPDGQPCTPPGKGCTTRYVGIILENCGCPGPGFGESFSWSLIPNPTPGSTVCTTILPPP